MVIKLRKIRLAGNVERYGGEDRRSLRERDNLEDLGVVGRIIIGC
jgi:hypothetical protein